MATLENSRRRWSHNFLASRFCDVDFGHGFWIPIAALAAGEWRLSQKRWRFQGFASGFCLGVDLVAVEGDGVVWLDQPCLKARIGEQRLGQLI